MITYTETLGAFYLDTRNTSYVIRILEDGTVAHSYYGARIPHEDLSYYNLFRSIAFSASTRIGQKDLSPETLMLEYPTFGRGDYRSPALVVSDCADNRVNELTYVSHRILNGKPRMEGMPQLDVNTQGCQTLELVLRDAVAGCEVLLYYTPFEDCDLIARRTVVRSTSQGPITVHNACSASFDLETGDFDMITLYGSWGRERYVERYPLHHGTNVVDSRRGASSHEMNPFTALVDRDANEDSGRVYGLSLVYSGDFRISAELDPFASTRVQIGLNPDTFSWQLAPGESLELPEALLTYSEEGLNGMSRNFHRACRSHLGKCADRNLRHPILINSWEAMYFDFDDQKFIRFVKDCAGLGLDTVVMDDGWFGHRDDDHSSLGDWFIYDRKLPTGLTEIIRTCHENNMEFGIWFEPEMISTDSKLYEAHPDWCIHVPGREAVESRNQRILDMSRPEVVDCIYNQMAKILASYDISYVKWDMNRHMTDNGSAALPPSQQGELGYRYIRGVYALMARLEENFPKVFFEGCSGGGGRFDFGILYYMPQIWTSDDSDAHERLKIQYGTSFVYPPSAIVAHVSACPNHQTGRTTSIDTRGDVAQAFSFGYEFDVGKLSQEERETIRRQIAKHRQLEGLVDEGEFYRLRSPFLTDCASWQLVSQDQKESFVVVAWNTSFLQPAPQYIKLKGLDPQRAYHIPQLEIVCSGATLMNVGLALTPPPMMDYPSLTLDLLSE